MRLFTSPALVLVASVIGSAAWAGDPGAPSKVAVVPTQVEGTVKGFPVRIFDDAVLTSVQQVTGHEVVGQDDIDTLLGFDKVKGLMGCDDTSCFAELGGALGVDLLVALRVAKMGDEWAVTAKLINIGETKVEARLTKFVPGDAKSLIKSTNAIIVELFAGQKTRPMTKPSPAATVAPPPPEPEPTPPEPQPWLDHGLTRDEWSAYQTYRGAAEKASITALEPSQWQSDIRDKQEIWLGYFEYCAKNPAASGGASISFEDWHDQHWLGELAIESVPAGAAVEADGESAGTAPVTLKLHGSHKIKVTLDGYLAQARSVSVPGGQQTTARFELVSGAEFEKQASAVDAERSSMLTWSLVSFGAAAALAGGGVAMIVLAGTQESIRTQYYVPYAQSADSDQADERYQQVRSAVELHNILFPIGLATAGLAAVAAGLGIYCLAARPSAMEATLEVAPSPGGATLLLRGRF